MDRLEEFRKGLNETGKYLLSHHKEDSLDRCHRFSFQGINLYLCARCTGIYTGIITAAVLIFNQFLAPTFLMAVLFPLPTLIEKYIEAGTEKQFSNRTRTISGFLLGTGYVAALFRLIQKTPDYRILIVGIAYMLASFVLYQKYMSDS